MNVTLTDKLGPLYAVMNHKGEWFRAKGLHGRGGSWVPTLSTARVYGKIGPARACVSFWAGALPKDPAPALVELLITEAVILDEAARVAKTKKTKAERDAKRREREARARLQWAKADMTRAKANVEAARKAAGK